MDWTDQGFKTGRVVLPGLEVTVDLAPNQYFRHDGLVDDLEEHAAYLRRTLGLDFSISTEDMIGFCYRLEYYILEDDKILPTPRVINQLAVITVVKKTTPTGSLKTVGHESTHALHHFGQERKLTEALQEYGFKLNLGDRYTDEEDICDIGGLFALYLAGELKNIDRSRSSKRVVSLLNDLLESGDYRR